MSLNTVSSQSRVSRPRRAISLIELELGEYLSDNRVADHWAKPMTWISCRPGGLALWRSEVENPRYGIGVLITRARTVSARSDSLEQVR